MKVWKYMVCVFAVVFVSSNELKAQRVAVHTDALQYALLSPNVGFEVALSQHHVFAFSSSVCPFEVNDRLYVKHLSVMPEYKYWFRMPFYGHYTGANMIYSSYDIGGKRYARRGNLVAACVNYGYSFIISRRWNVIPHAGVGVGVDVGDNVSFVPLVAKIGVNLQIVIK